MVNWSENVLQLKSFLDLLSLHNDSGKELELDNGFLKWKDITCEVRAKRKTVYLIGNGASASMASHVAADLAKNAHVHTQVFTDLALITAVANDLCYEEVYAEPLRRRMNQGDLLVAISSSGQSANILRAVHETKRLNGFVVTLSAMKPDNMIRKQGNLNFYVPAKNYSMAETCHAAILHFWMDQMVETTQFDKSSGD
jgi:D-sedoheptulose 7-phosphate isomerase